MNRLNNPRYNLHPSDPLAPKTLAQLKEYIKKNVKRSIAHKFKTPKDLDIFVEEYSTHNKTYKSKLKWFTEELNILESKIGKPGFHAEYLWDKLIHLAVKMYDSKYFCYDIFQGRIYNLAKNIIETDTPTT